MTIKRLLPLILSGIFLCGACFTPPASGAEGDAKAMYLVEEGFYCIRLPGGGVTLSGWDTDTRGGTLTGSLQMNDTSSTAPVSISRSFKPATSGIVTAEVAFAFTDVFDSNDVAWQLKGGSTVAVNVFTQNGRINLASGGGTYQVGSFHQGPWFILKIVADMGTKTVDIYLNGQLSVQNRAFTNNVSVLDGISISTGDRTVCTLNLNLCHVYKDYYLNERFASLRSESSLPSNWTGNSGAGIRDMHSGHYRDRASVRLNPGGAYARADFAADTGSLVWEYSFYVPEKADGLTAAITDGNDKGLTIVTADGNLCVSGAGGQNRVIWENYRANVWYMVRAHINTAQKTADIYVNDRLRAAGEPLGSTVQIPTKVLFSTPSSGGGTMWIDDILVYPEAEEPADYVPAPQPVDTGGVYVGVQSCSLWREGSQSGWDMIAPYPERVPYLGFYDEGNPETADWEIKWLLEHGIGFMSFCWFRSTSQDTPIKTPTHGEHLHRGFLRAKYSDSFKFMIMWENLNDAGISGIGDFRDNVLPFWVEHYLKDPRYLVIDNKPVISLFSYDTLKEQLGATPVSEFTGLIRQACVEIGFSGAYLLISTAGTNTSQLNEMKNGGVDGVYPYSWGDFSGFKAVQQSSLLAQRSSNLEAIPTVTVGRDNRGVFKDSGQIASPAEFTSAAKWVNDEFRRWYVENRPSGIAAKMMLIGNWNEFGEGHYIQPSTLAGFEYLDGIRSLFTSSPHTDIAPTAAQKERINVLYNRRDNLPLSEIPRTVPAPQLTRAKWDFDASAEGWRGSSSTVTYSGGCIRVTGSGSGTTRRALSADNLGIDITGARFLKIRMQNNNSPVNCRIYFSTDSSPTMAEDKRVDFLTAPAGNGFTEHIIDMGKNENWTGTLRQLRFDLPSGTQAILIDYVYIMEDGFVTTGESVLNEGEFRYMALPDGADNCEAMHTSTEFFNGFRSLEIKSRQGGGRVWFNLPDVKNYAPYYYSGFVKVPFDTVPDSAATFKIMLSYNVNGEEKEVVVTEAERLSGDFWRRVDGAFAIEENAPVSNVRLVLFAGGTTGTDTFFIDAPEARPINIDVRTTPQRGEEVRQAPNEILLAFPAGKEVNPPSVSAENILINGTPAASAEVYGDAVVIIPAAELKRGRKYTVAAKNLGTNSGIDIPNIVFDFVVCGVGDVPGEKFYVNYGTEAGQEIDPDDFTVSGSVTVTAVTGLFSDYSAPKEAAVVLALYDGARLKKLSIQPVTLLPGSENIIISEIEVSGGAGKGYSVKHLIWDGFSALNPLF